MLEPNAATQETNLSTVSDEIKTAIANDDRDTIAEALEKGDLSVSEYEQLRNSSKSESTATKETDQADAEKNTETEAEPDTSEKSGEGETDKTSAEEPDEISKLKKQIEDKEKFILQRNAEIGDLRKKEKELSERLSKIDKKPIEMTDEDWTKYNENPKAFVKSTVEEDQKQKSEAEAKFKEEEKIFLNLFSEKVKSPLSQALPEMIKILKEDGLPDEVIEGFKADPYQNGGAFLIQLGLRTADRKRFKTSVENNENYAKEIAARTNSKTPAVTSKASGTKSEGITATIASAFKSGGRDALAEMIDSGEATTAEVKEFLQAHG